MTIQDPCSKHEGLLSYKWPGKWNDDDNGRESYSKTKQINIWDLSNPHSSHCNALQPIPTQKILSICDSNWRTINGKPAHVRSMATRREKKKQNRGQVTAGGHPGGSLGLTIKTFNTNHIPHTYMQSMSSARILVSRCSDRSAHEGPNWWSKLWKLGSPRCPSPTKLGNPPPRRCPPPA